MTHLREISYTEELKGLAILAVVILHILSNLPSSFITDPNHLPVILAIDQIGRFCVPLFVAISGFGLMRKYMVKNYRFAF
jgi:surface polysaccharide O-acyltransferase-like enzyme